MNGVSGQTSVVPDKANRGPEPTAYHEDLRREMIQEMAQFGSYGQFDSHEREIQADDDRRNPRSGSHGVRCDCFQSHTAGLAFSRPPGMAQRPRQAHVSL